MNSSNTACGGNVLRKEQRAALPPYATQLFNAGCRVISIQRFLGHKELRTTMIYVHAYDQTVAEDYFAAMERVEKRLDIVPKEQQENYQDVNVLEEAYVKNIIRKLAQPEITLNEMLDLVSVLQEELLHDHL